MKCDCVKDIERKIAEHMRPQAGDDIKVECQATSIVLGKDMDLSTALGIPFKVTGSKKGYTSAKGKQMPCFASFCPFCGRSAKHYAVGDDAGIAAALATAGAA